jgi:hypothetical protein
MGQVIQVNGDYNIKAKDGARITLDTGPQVGEVLVTGNLVVNGETLTVSTTNLQVHDNIITLNYGETGAGVTLRYSGIEVDRGSLIKTAFVYDENDGSWNIGEGTSTGGYSFVNSSLRLKQVLTNAVTDNGDLTLIGTGTGVVKVTGTADYENQVTDDDDIPNKKYVDVAIQTSPTFQIKRDNTRVIAFDSDQPVDAGLFPIGPFYVQPLESQVAILVDDNIVGTFFKNRYQAGGLTFFTEAPTPFNSYIPNASVIQTTNTNANIKLETNGTGKVEVTYAVQYNNSGLTPASVFNSSLLYGGSIGPGDTGLHFTNTFKTDEVISKNKALVFSMIF